MKTTHALSIAALVAAMAATPALANDLTNTVNKAVDQIQTTVDNAGNTIDNATGAITNSTSTGDTNTSTGDVSNSGGNASLGNVGTFGDFLSGFEAGHFNAPISDVGKITDVKVIDVSNAFSDFDLAAFNDALSRNQTSLDVLRDSLNGNEAAKNLLSGNNVSVSHIVGIDNKQDGALVIYTDGRS